MTHDLQPRIELLCLLALPLAAAIVVALLGPERKEPIRWISLAATCVSMFLALLLAWRLMDEPKLRPDDKSLPTFRPHFVPGSPRIGTDNRGHPPTIPHGTSWDLLKIPQVAERESNDKGRPPTNDGSGAIQFYIGLDGLNVWLVVLTAVLSVPAVLVSWNQITERVNEFYAWLLALQTAMMGI